ncbi:MAG: LamB/YcsF family protein [Gemmataceae bacterium]
MQPTIDLNCDLGEGYGTDSEVIPLVTSANVACGFHAGDPRTIHATLTAAAKHQVRIGAHPGFPDKEHFGRHELQLTEQEIYQDCVYQIGALAGLAQSVGIRLSYIKPHGALYNRACRDNEYARPIVASAELFGLAILGLPDSCLQRLAKGRCRFVAEGFADRRYTSDGALVSRTDPDPFITDISEAIDQVQRLITVRHIETICVHGDNPQALTFVRGLRSGLTEAGFFIQAFS